MKELRHVFSNLPCVLKSKVPIVLLLLFISSILDILGIGILLPFLKILVDGEFLKSFPFIRNYDKPNGILILSAFILAVYIVKNTMALFIEKQKIKFVFDVFYTYSLSILKKYQEKGLLWFSSHDSTILFRNIYLAPYYYATNVVFAYLNLLMELIIILILMCGLIYTNAFAFFILVCVTLPFLYLYFKFSRKRTLEIGNQLNEIGPEVHQSINNIIFGFHDIEIYQKKRQFTNKYNEKIQSMINSSIKNQMLLYYPSRLLDTIVVISLITIVVIGVSTTNDPKLILNTLLAFGLVAMRSVPSINKISASITSIRSYNYTIQIVNNEIEKDKNITEIQNRETTLPIKFEHSIKLKNLSFSYPGSNKLVLNAINLNFIKGETIGLIGESGSGKTTLISILAQLNFQTKGEILIDDYQLLPEDKLAWQKNIGYVSQSVFIMSGSLRDNIVFGNEKINEELLKRCIEGASLSKLVDAHSDKENMLLKENGSNLSGGQRQRVGIARALYSQASLFIFDEATSALDAETEKDIMESIKLLSSNGYTIIIVAHRISTLENCNKIYKLKEGVMIDEQTYAQLVAKSSTS